jgi:CRP-like cAMP-binding protein
MIERLAANRTGVQSPMSRGEAIHRSSIRNKLLLRLTPISLKQLSPFLHRTPLRARQILVEPNVRVGAVYFIEEGIAAIVSRSEQGRPMEVAMIGSWGVAGVPAILGTYRSPFRCIVQIPGTALRMSAFDLQQAMDQVPEFRQVLMNYIQARMVQQAQVTICNARHSVQERVARWLLMGVDRLESNSVPVTHDLIGRMLGVRRAGVTVAIRELEAKGLVRHERGQIQLLSRDKLEESCCPCYRFVQREYDRLIGRSAPLQPASQAISITSCGTEAPAGSA